VEFLPDIQTVISWKKTCSRFKKIADEKVDVKKVARKQIAHLYIYLCWDMVQGNSFKFHFCHHKYQLFEKTNVKLETLTKHWKITIAQLYFNVNAMESQQLISALINSQMQIASVKILALYDENIGRFSLLTFYPYTVFPLLEPHFYSPLHQ